MGRKIGVRTMVVVTAFLLSMLCAGAAQGADRVYWWADEGLRFANVDGSGQITEINLSLPAENSEGTVVDPVANRIYWLSRVGNDPPTIRFSNLDGTGVGALNVAGASIQEAMSLAIDPVGRRLYWSDDSPSKISFAKLDGSGGGTLPLTRVHRAGAVAVDPSARRIYWVNKEGQAAEKLSFANLDGTGEGSLPIGAATVNNPHGAAIDPAGKRIFWANLNADRISFGNLDGSGGGDLNTSGATVNFPRGVAVDPISGRVYWGDSGGVLSFAKTDGSGGGDLWHGPVFASVMFPVLYRAPHSVSAPVVSGSVAVGATLACSNGTWSPDSPEAQFTIAPQGAFAYQWSRGGADLPGATQSTLKVEAAGEYRCKVTARNGVDSTTATSAPFKVQTGPGGPKPPAATPASLRLALVTAKLPAGAPLAVRITNSGGQAASGTLSGSSKIAGKGKPRTLKLAAKQFKVAPGASAVVKLRLPKPLQATFAQRHKLSVVLMAAFSSPGSGNSVATKKVTPRLHRSG